MAAPYLVFGAGTGALVMCSVLGLYMLWPGERMSGFGAWRQKQPRPSTIAPRPGLYANQFLAAGGIARPRMSPALVVLAVWMFAVYDLSEHKNLKEIWRIGAIVVTCLVLIETLLEAATYLRPLISARRRGALSGSLPAFIHADAAKLLRSPILLWNIGSGIAMCGAMSVMAGTFAYESLARSLTRDHVPSVYEIAEMFPVLPLNLLATSALFVITVGPKQPAIVQAFLARTQQEATRRIPAWQTLVTASASFAILIAAIYSAHFSTVAALSSVAGLKPLEVIYKTVPEWVAKQRDNGLIPTKVAAKLNKHGYWRRDTPDAGLAALMPVLGATLGELGGACEIAITAAPADPAAVAGKDWIPAMVAQSDIKYCVRIACPSPVKWDAPPSSLLHSSHPSRNRYWMKSLYIDIFADGVASSPGGYCPAEGRLAEDFQG